MEEERKDESPASWRLGLRKTGSYGALAEITATKEAQREKDTTGVMRSASSPRLSSSLDNKDKDKVCVVVQLDVSTSDFGLLQTNMMRTYVVCQPAARDGVRQQTPVHIPL